MCLCVRVGFYQALHAAWCRVWRSQQLGSSAPLTSSPTADETRPLLLLQGRHHVNGERSLAVTAAIVQTIALRRLLGFGCVSSHYAVIHSFIHSFIQCRLPCARALVSADFQ